MKYVLFFKYLGFVEKFVVDVYKGNLSYELTDIFPYELYKSDWESSIEFSSGSIFLDFSGHPNVNYTAFAFEEGDMLVIQRSNKFLVGLLRGKIFDWLKFDANSLINYLVGEISRSSDDLMFLVENQEYCNFLLNDLYRTDYSDSKENRLVKALKLVLLGSFIGNRKFAKPRRVILDQTLLGDVKIDDVALGLRSLGCDFISAYKISNEDKVKLALKQKGVFDFSLEFDPTCFVVSRPGSSLINFVSKDSKLEYRIERGQNYVFEIPEGSYELILDHDTFYNGVKGTVYLFNGNKCDLIVKADETVF